MQVLKWLGIELVEVSWMEKLVSVTGSGLAILCVFLITQHSLPATAAAGVIASMGASAVLLYAVPHGPLSQPWPLIGGHSLSAIIGVCCAQWISHPAVATAVAVGLAIGAMYQLKCIHPPGGATAFTAVMGGQAVQDLGFGFVLYPVLLNAVVMLLLAILINFPFRWRRYPASLMRGRGETKFAVPSRSREVHDDVLAAFQSLDSFIDVSEDDLLYLTRALSDRLATVQTKESSDRWIELDDESAEEARRH